MFFTGRNAPCEHRLGIFDVEVELDGGAAETAGRAQRRDANIDVALDMIYGPIFYRLQIGHAAVDGAFIQDLMSEAMRGLRPER